MREPARLWFAVEKLKSIHKPKGRWVGTMTPRRQVNDDAREGQIEKENHDPVVAFSRPPPLPPFIGPLVALSLLQSWSKRDGNDD
nr:uncharacterized protein LOC105158209 [Ipomoea trifida]